MQTYQEWVRERTCFRKNSYPTKKRAHKAIKKHKKLNEKPIPLYIYNCNICNNYHLSKKRPSEEC